MAYSKTSNLTQRREIKYLNKDFESYRDQLIEFTKVYYPNTFNDFSEGSPGMMFMEMAAYVGDVLSYYTDTQLQETFLDTAQERTNLFHLAYTLGYKPNVTAVSSTNLDIFQLVPSKGNFNNKVPDFDYALTIDVPSNFSSDNGIIFNLQRQVNFSYSSSFDPTEINVYSINDYDEPEYYLLKKTTPVFSSELMTKTFNIGSPQRYHKLDLIDQNIVGIQTITDSEGNTWYEVPYLAQDTIFEEIQNVKGNTPNLYEYQVDTPYLLKLKRVPRRFITRFKENGILEIHFGAGSSDIVDELVLPNPDNVGLGNRDGRSKLDQSIDPSNFLHSKAYGQIPTNTTLTVSYLRGGGITSNVPANTINQPAGLSTTFKPKTDGKIVSFAKESIACTNPEPSTGGGPGDSNEDIRLNTKAAFSSQQRVVTREDYLVRTLSMNSRLGSVAKAYIVKDNELRNANNLSNIVNPLSSNLYVLGYNRNKHLSTLNTATKTNLISYLDRYKPLTDSINIKDAFIINFGIDFEITTFKNINDQQVLLDCIASLKDYFDIDKWQINQPIMESEVYNIIANNIGVQSVTSIELKNITGKESGYSQFKYDFEQATKKGIIYPSMDPSIFEIKYLNSDIKGKITQY